MNVKELLKNLPQEMADLDADAAVVLAIKSGEFIKVIRFNIDEHDFYSHIIHDLLKQRPDKPN